MNPGRELDIKIAIEVMGWYAVEPISYEFGKDQVFGSPTEKRDGGRRGEWVEVPHYSTNISDAWLVVEKMGKKYRIMIDLFDGGVWDVWILGGESPNVLATVQTSTAPHAICLAALEAVKAA